MFFKTKADESTTFKSEHHEVVLLLGLKPRAPLFAPLRRPDTSHRSHRDTPFNTSYRDEEQVEILGQGQHCVNVLGLRRTLQFLGVQPQLHEDTREH